MMFIRVRCARERLGTPSCSILTGNLPVWRDEAAAIVPRRAPRFRARAAGALALALLGAPAPAAARPRASVAKPLSVALNPDVSSSRLPVTGNGSLAMSPRSLATGDGSLMTSDGSLAMSDRLLRDRSGAIQRRSLAHGASLHGTGPEATRRRSPRGWLTWTLAALGAGTAGVAVAGLAYREKQARRWNDPALCLEAARTRGEVCAREYRRLLVGQRAALAGGALSVVFVSGAILNAVLNGSSSGRPRLRAKAAGCALRREGVVCSVSF